MASRIARLLREPLLHFLLAGALLFAIFGRGGGSDARQGDRDILVTSGDVQRLAVAFTRTWNRPPDQTELQAQIRDYIREEVLYRTAIGMGLDRDDIIIRRRLRQKMDFLFEDTVPPPQDAELRTYFDQHPEKFRDPARVSFRQIFVSQRRGNTAEADAHAILAALASGDAGAEEDGDPFPLGEGVGLMPVDQVAAQFGGDFARSIMDVPTGRWTGPIRSAFGLHLVLVTDVKPATLAPFEQARPTIEREWLAEHRAASVNAQYQALLGRYKVTVQQGDAGP